MSLLRSVLSAASPLVLAAATLSAGCTEPYKSVACSPAAPSGTVGGCPTIDQIAHLTYSTNPGLDGASYIAQGDGFLLTGISQPAHTACCTSGSSPVGVCVIPALGCDSGYRLVASHDGGGYDVSVCAPTNLMCAQELGDMTPAATDM